MDNLGLSHVQTSTVQSNAASGTKCSRNQRKFSLNDARANRSTSSSSARRFIVSWHRCSSSQAAWPPRGCRRGGLLLGYLPGSPLCLLQAEDGSRRGWTSPSLRPSPMCCAGCGGSMLRQNLSASGAVVSQLHWLPCNKTPPRCTGTVSPATPCDDQDVGSCSSCSP